MKRLLLPLAFMVYGIAMSQRTDALLALYADRPGFAYPETAIPEHTYESPGSPAEQMRPMQLIIIKAGQNEELSVQGMDDGTVSWTSIFPGNLGEWNHILDCPVGCQTVSIVPDAQTPPTIDFRVCGTPLVADDTELTRCKVLRVRITQ